MTQTSAKPKKPKFISLPGVAVYPWLNQPDTKFDKEGRGGVYKTDLRLTSAAFQEVLPAGALGKTFPGGLSFQQWLDGLVEESLAEAQKEHPKEKRSIKVRAPYEFETDDSGEPVGTVLVRFKQNAKITRKDGTVITVTIPLFNGRGEPIEDAIWGGSTIKVAFTLRNTWMQANKEAGLRLDINAVQVLKIAKSDKSASDFGFDVDDSANADDEPGEDEAGSGTGDF